jgi:hypothetical protein
VKYGEVKHAVEKKMPGDPARCTKESNRWAELDGRKVLRVAVPKKHVGDLKPKTLNSIRQQLHLDHGQFEDFVHCRLGGSEYETHLRSLIAAGRL